MSRDYSKGPTFIKRAKHRKGHGVHSPFAYKLITEAFGARECPAGARELYDALTSAGIKKRHAVSISSVYDFCGFDGYAIDAPAENVDNSVTISIAGPSCGVSYILSLAESMREGCALCITLPRQSERKELCARLVSEHNGMSLENRVMLLLFYGRGLNRQHIRL